MVLINTGVGPLYGSLHIYRLGSAHRSSLTTTSIARHIVACSVSTTKGKSPVSRALLFRCDSGQYDTGAHINGHCGVRGFQIADLGDRLKTKAIPVLDALDGEAALLRVGCTLARLQEVLVSSGLLGAEVAEGLDLDDCCLDSRPIGDPSGSGRFDVLNHSTAVAVTAFIAVADLFEDREDVTR